MQNVKKGDFVYVTFTQIRKVQTFISIKSRIDDKDVICGVSEGDTFVFRHPDKMYLSFISQQTDAKFYVNSYYSNKLTKYSYVNEKNCSDKGAHLGDITEKAKKTKKKNTTGINKFEEDEDSEVSQGNMSIRVQGT